MTILKMVISLNFKAKNAPKGAFLAFTASILRWIFPLEKSTKQRPKMTLLVIFDTFCLRQKGHFMAFTSKDWRLKAPIVGGKGINWPFFCIFKMQIFCENLQKPQRQRPFLLKQKWPKLSRGAWSYRIRLRVIKWKRSKSVTLFGHLLRIEVTD